jgi:CHAT domain-containing protein
VAQKFIRDKLPALVLAGCLLGMPAASQPEAAYPPALIQAGEQALKLVEQGRFEQALPLWRQLLSWQQQHLGADDPRSLRSLRNLAAVALAAGDAPEAAQLYSELRERLMRLQGPATAESTQAALDLARAWRTQTRFQPAETLTRDTLVLLQKIGTQDPQVRQRTADAQELLGTIAHEQGRYPQAEQAHRTALALRIALEGSGSLSAASARGNLAQALLRQGRYAEALELQRQALTAYQTLSGVDTRRQQATVLSNMAFSQNLLGQGQQSLSTLNQAVGLRSQLQGMDHPETARLLLNLGALEADLGNPSAALGHYRSALTTMQRRLGPQHLGTAFALQRMAELARSQKQSAPARQWGLAALAIREQQLPPDHPDLATTLVGLGLSELALGQQRQADAHLRRAVEIRRRALGPDHPYTGLAELLLGLALWEGKDPAEARQHLEQAIQAYDAFLRSQAPLLAVRERGRLLASVAESRNAFYSLVLQGPQGRDLALRARLNLHGRLEEIERRQSSLFRHHPEGLNAAERLEAINTQLEQEQLESAMRQRMEQQRQALNRTLQELQQGEARGDAVGQVSVAQIAGALPSDSALVEFLQIQPVKFRQGRLQGSGEARLTALVLTPEGQVQSVDLGPVAPINQAIWKALAETQRAGLDSDAAWTRVGDLVLRPLLPQLASRRIWFLSPDGELHRVPFAALARQEGGALVRYGDIHTIRLLTSARDLLQRRPTAAVGARQPALVLADPDFDAVPPGIGPAGSHGTSIATLRTDRETPLPEAWRTLRWSRLPASRGEGESLRELLDATLITDAGASRAAVVAARSPTYLHVASHGAFLPAARRQAPSDQERQQALEGRAKQWDDPMQRAVVVLSGANRSNSREQAAGYLTAAEASRLQLEGTRLVTLSACETGMGTIELGDGVYGLRRALAVAGAESSLLSLWKVDDRATRALMEAFYSRLQRGESPEQALRGAQQLMRHHERRDWQHPYVWAAFQLYGRSW